MIITVLLLISCVAALLTGLVYYRGKYWNYLDISEKATAEAEDIEEKWFVFKEEAKIKFNKSKEKLKADYKVKLRNAVNKKAEEIEKSLKEKYDLLALDLEQDYNNACEEVKNELFEQIGKVDAALQEHLENLALKNILTFSCSCSKDLIPCPIDFTKENTFVCPKCGSKYKIAISANPILVGRAISEEQFSDLLEKRLNEN